MWGTGCWISTLLKETERERKLYCRGFSGPHKAGRGYVQEPLPIVLSLFLFPFPSFNCVRFSPAPGYSQSFSRSFLLLSYPSLHNSPLPSVSHIRVFSRREIGSFGNYFLKFNLGQQQSQHPLHQRVRYSPRRQDKKEDAGRRYKIHFNIAWNLSKTSP